MIAEKGLKSKRRSSKISRSKAKKDFDKYAYYRASVQSPDTDVEFLKKTYEELREGKKPKVLCEDFCGTFDISCHWVKLEPSHESIAVDLDPEPLEYGRKHYFSKLSSDQQQRIQVLNQNVLSEEIPPADIVAALNFSYFIFKERNELKNYMAKVLKRLNSEGLFIVDCFGGSQCQEPNEEETEHETFSYFWDQDSFDPITHHAMFYIHFRPKGDKKREKVFSYDWRMWSIPEIRDVMMDVGFKDVKVYWEGTTEDGEGDGEFFVAQQGEPCESWVAYIVGLK